MIEDVSDATRVPSGAEVEAQLRAFGAAPSAVELLQTLDPFSAALLEQVRAGRRLAEAVDEVAAALPVDIDDLTVHALQFARGAMELGYLAFAY